MLAHDPGKGGSLSIELSTQFATQLNCLRYSVNELVFGVGVWQAAPIGYWVDQDPPFHTYHSVAASEQLSPTT